ncbi:MAG: type II toxin-antitoxin system RelE/ParE family toxin [Planctomycetota bacterium]|nr:MAG: type II toxin-antitoxin system RelE/ParE family toxin [Planctomycetota bacterium]REK29771.1 MAG: type II toxin-antitoxin system RelE/ParE family toxin [Planctomycetota bacterium]REK30409.1 MAG: type II toxin-antitoxin system RelE/ParE family toxin [Planctomycetota bacterium]
MRDYQLSRQADRALDDIADHIARDNPAAAKRVTTAIVETFKTIAANPGIGQSCDHLREGLRVFPAKEPAQNYIVFYYEATDCIEIIAVLHGARDWQGMLGRGELGN